MTGDAHGADAHPTDGEVAADGKVFTETNFCAHIVKCFKRAGGG
jgi:hypothetical protein